MGGHRLDATPRIPDPGRMNTSLIGGIDRSLSAPEEEFARLGHAFVLPGGLQIGGVLEAPTLFLQTSLSLDTPGIVEQEGYYAGAFLKRPLVRDHSFRVSGHGGFGLGGYGEYVGYADAFGGSSLGFDSRILSPYASATLGLVLPYRRKGFVAETASFIVSGSFTERFRFASAAWLLAEIGLESPFGNPESGLRAFFSLGMRWSLLLESDRIGSDADSFPLGMGGSSRLGLSWTY